MAHWRSVANQPFPAQHCTNFTPFVLIPILVPMAHLLITGGAGFIGSHLAERLLADGHEVTLVDDLSTGRMENIRTLLNDSRIRLVRESVENIETVNLVISRCDAVFHLAAAVGELYGILRRDGSTAAFAGRMVDFAAFNEIVGLSKLREAERGYEEEAAELAGPAANPD